MSTARAAAIFREWDQAMAKIPPHSATGFQVFGLASKAIQGLMTEVADLQLQLDEHGPYVPTTYCTDDRITYAQDQLTGSSQALPGSILRTTDTLREFRWDGIIWIEQQP